MAEQISFVIIATGADEDAPGTFTSLAERRVRSLVRRFNKEKGSATALVKPPARVRFIYYDFESNAASVYGHPFPEKGLKKPPGTIKWQTLALFDTDSDTPAGIEAGEGGGDNDPTSFADEPGALVAGGATKCSIVNIYHTVRAAPRASVLEVSLFSHGFVQGPVLANTTDRKLSLADGTPQRTPEDQDGRVRTDFLPHMGESPTGAGKDALKEFAGGFAAGGTLRIYGCNVQDVVDVAPVGGSAPSYIRSTVRQVLRQAFTKRLKKKDAITKKLRAGKIPTDALELDMGEECDIEASLTDHAFTHFPSARLLEIHYAIDPAFFGGATTRKISKTLSEVIKFVARETAKAYVFKAAEALPDVTCFGAVPGTGGNFEDSKLTDAMMWVSRDNNEGNGPYLQFFESFMGVSVTEKNAERQRNYGVFNAAAVTAIKDRITGS